MRCAAAFDQLQAALFVDDEHAFDHAAEDRLHAGAVGGELRGAAADLANGVVEHARHDADLIVPVSRTLPAEIAGGVAPRRVGDRAHAAGQQRRGDPGQRQASTSPTSSATRRRDGRRRVARAFGQRQREADDGDVGDRPAADRRPRRRACRCRSSRCTRGHAEAARRARRGPPDDRRGSRPTRSASVEPRSRRPPSRPAR